MKNVATGSVYIQKNACKWHPRALFGFSQLKNNFNFFNEIPPYVVVALKISCHLSASPTTTIVCHSDDCTCAKDGNDGVVAISFVFASGGNCAARENERQVEAKPGVGNIL